MAWIKENWPWKFHIEIQTANPMPDGLSDGKPIDDWGGISGSKKFRFCWGGGETEEDAIKEMKKVFNEIVKEIAEECRKARKKGSSCW